MTAGVIKVGCKAAGGGTTIAGIVKSVEEAQARTAPVQKMADAGVLAAALFTPFLMRMHIPGWLQH